MKALHVCILSCLVMVSGCGSTSGTVVITPELGSIDYTKAALERLIKKEIDQGLPSISISLVKEDQIVWSAAYGFASVATRTAATPETIYMTASTVKPVTGTALLSLVDQGLVALDDPANKYLGEFAVSDSPTNTVTIRSLLNHTSGLTDAGPGTGANYMANVWSRERENIPSLREIAKQLESIHPVGDTWSYNNSAYAVAALIVEIVSGVPFEQYVVENVLSPIGATTQHPFFPDAEIASRIAQNYHPTEDDTFAPADHAFMSFYPAGGARVTAEDMARFLGAHLNGGEFNGNQILSADLVHQSHQANLEKYGLGWWTYVDEQGHTRITHGGNWFTAVAVMLGDKDAKVGAYVMTNIGQTQATFRIADAAIRLLRGEEVGADDRPFIQLSPETLDRFVGTYEQANGLEIAVSREGNTLRYAYPPPYDATVYTFFPATETSFFEPDVGIELDFKSSSDGEVLGYEMTQHGWIDYGFSDRKTGAEEE